MPLTSRAAVAWAAVTVCAAGVAVYVFAWEPPMGQPIETGRRADQPAPRTPAPESLAPAAVPVRVPGPREQVPAPAIDEQVPQPEPGPVMPSIEPSALAPTLGASAAAEVVGAMEGHWQIYRSVKFQGRTDSHAVQMDYLFAVWPDLGALLDQKLATARVFAVGPGAPPTAPPGFVNYGFDVTQEVLTVSFQTPNWRTTITFTAASGNEALFEKVVQAVNAELAGRK